MQAFVQVSKISSDRGLCAHSKLKIKCMLQKFKFFKLQKVDDKILVCKISKNFLSKPYHIENAKTRGQIV